MNKQQHNQPIITGFFMEMAMDDWEQQLSAYEQMELQAAEEEREGRLQHKPKRSDWK